MKTGQRFIVVSFSLSLRSLGHNENERMPDGREYDRRNVVLFIYLLCFFSPSTSLTHSKIALLTSFSFFPTSSSSYSYVVFLLIFTLDRKRAIKRPLRSHLCLTLNSRSIVAKKSIPQLCIYVTLYVCV